MRPLLLVLVAVLVPCGACARGTRTTLYRCTACLADDPSRCVVHDDACGGSSADLGQAQWAARSDLCQSLPPAVLARHPVADGSPATQHPEAYRAYGMNACFDWVASDFRYECTSHEAQCSGVPIH